MRRLLAAAFVAACAALPARADELADGDAAMKAKDYPRAAELYRKAADMDSPLAADRLGLMYKNGWGVARDYAEALKWFRQAAKLNNSQGMADLGVMYQEGRGTARDPREAMRWYGLAVERGNVVAANNVGTMYESGQGVVQDYVAAYAWYLIAQSRGGSAHTARNIARLQKKMTNEQVAAAQRQASAAVARGREIAQRGVGGSDADHPTYRRPENEDDYAVVVGVEKYAGLPPATYAERDARAVREHLLALGYPARNILLLAGSDATKAKLTAALNAWLPNRVDEKSRVFFYYSGHGAPDASSRQAYLVPADGEPEDLADTAVPVKQLYQKLGALKAKSVLVALDSCFSGAGGRSVLPKGARPLVTKVESGADALSGGKVVALGASSGEEISGALDAQRHGLFTYFLLRGLNGAAADASGRVTVQSLYKYLRPQVADIARLQNRDQTPQLNPPAADAVLR